MLKAVKTVVTEIIFLMISLDEMKVRSKVIYITNKKNPPNLLGGLFIKTVLLILNVCSCA
jgi:hypothetical protein